MNHAYLDKYGILHVTSSQREGSVLTAMPCEGGYPLCEGQVVCMYSLEEAYLGGNRNSFEAGEAKKMDLKLFPEFVTLYKKCQK